MRNGRANGPGIVGAWRGACTRHAGPSRGCPAVFAAFALAIIALAGGCAGDPAALRRDLAKTRAADAATWRAAREGGRTQQPVLSGALTLSDAVRLALRYNKALQAVAETTNAAAARLLSARGAALPTAALHGDYTRLDEPPHASFGDQRLDLGLGESYAAGLVVKQPLYGGGAIRSGLRAARLNAALGDERVRAQAEATLYDTVAGYYATLLAEALYQVQRQAVVSAEAHLADLRKRHRQGTASDYDVLRGEVEVSNHQAEMIRQRNRIARSRAALLRTLGARQEGDLSLADSLTFAPATTTEAEAALAALAHRPELYEADLDVRLAREALRAARSAYRPRLDAVLSGTEANPGPHTPTREGWGAGWSAGLELAWPLFDLGREGRVAEAAAEVSRREALRADTREQVLMEVRQAVLSCRDAREFVESQQRNLDRAAEGLRLVELGYRQGLQSEVEVTDARTATTQTRGLYYQALYDYAMARLELQRATGQLVVLRGRPTSPASGPEAAPPAPQTSDAPAPEADGKTHGERGNDD